MADETKRIEHDSLGEIEVPAGALWGAQTQRAVHNFAISGRRMPRAFIRALGLIKQAAAEVNHELGLLDLAESDGIAAAAEQVASGSYDEQFPVDVFQTGSGTSSNMNANEVIARLAARAIGSAVHPNDDVNMSQSSNDVVPSAIHLAAALLVHERLLPALDHLSRTIDHRARELAGEVKTGRTHLMDAMPVRLDQELGGWRRQVELARERIEGVRPRLHALAQGGTAVGTGVNAPDGFGRRVAERLGALTGLPLRSADDYFERQSSQDTAVELSGQLKTLAVGLMKIANDLRWMNSGPLSGLGEIRLPALQPGSSIMPGKVNPVVPEAVAMVAAQVIGNDAAITIAGQSGNFQLNVMLPVIACNLLESLEICANAATALADSAIAGFELDRERIARGLHANPMLVTALAPRIGYDKAAEIAKRALAEGRPIADLAAELTDLSPEELRSLLDPAGLTGAGEQ